MPSKSSLCWDCANACRKCPWSRDFKPVSGWEATPTKVYQAEGKYEDSFFVHSCPMFKEDNRQSLEYINPDYLADKLGVSRRSIYRMEKNDLIRKCKDIGIEFVIGNKKGETFMIKKGKKKASGFIPLEILKMFWKATGYTEF